MQSIKKLYKQIFRKRPLFFGEEDVNNMRSIVRLHGTDKMLNFIEKYDLKIDNTFA